MTTIACTLTDQDRALYRGRWDALGAPARVGIATTARGLRLEFDAKPGIHAELTDLVALERDCCAFATWTLSEDMGRIVLDVAAKTDDAVPAVQEMFRSFRRQGTYCCANVRTVSMRTRIQKPVESGS